MRKNKLRDMLNAGQMTLGTHIHSSWPTIVEVVGHTGLFDYVEFDAEYAPYDLYTLDNFSRAVELFDMSSMIKLDQDSRAYWAQKAIGAGFQSVLFADCRTADDVRDCVRAVRPETPSAHGQHGVGMRRFSYMSYGGTPDYVKALEEIVVVIMIEKQAAVENLDEILAVKGVDIVQWGPADYSMSIGKPGTWPSPELRDVERYVIETSQRAGIPARAEMSSPDQAAYYLDMGVRHFTLGTDVAILFNWLKANGEQLRKALS